MGRGLGGWGMECWVGGGEWVGVRLATFLATGLDGRALEVTRNVLRPRGLPLYARLAAFSDEDGSLHERDPFHDRFLAS